MPLVERAQPKTHKYTGSLAASFNTSGTPSHDYEMATIQMTWSGANATDAVAQIEVSNDNTNWNNLGGTPGRATLSSAADTQIWMLQDIAFKYLRLAYSNGTNTTGTATITMDLLK